MLTLFEKLERTEFDSIKTIDATEPLLINRLYDEKRFESKVYNFK